MDLDKLSEIALANHRALGCTCEAWVDFLPGPVLLVHHDNRCLLAMRAAARWN
jgi:hypothetical protein